MSLTSSKKNIRSLGEDDEFTLYMFEEDLEMIEKWATEASSLSKRPSGGYMLGLLTNTLNPVCHIICDDDIPAEYLFLKNLQFENPIESPFFNSFGYWSFEQFTEDGRQDIKSKQNTSTLPQRFVFLSVEKINQDRFAYHPLLFIKERQKVVNGRIEQLQGKNPYRLPNISHNETANAPKERTTKGQVSSLRNKFEAFNKAKSQISPTSTATWNPQESTSYASVTRQGIQGNWLKVTDQTSTKGTLITSYCETFPSSKERFKEQKSENVSEHNLKAQWYDKRPDDLKTIYDFVLNSLAGDQETVNMSRDKTTLDMTITFTHHNYNWAIHFPSDFPTGTVKLKKTFGSAERAYSYSVEGLGSIAIFKAELESTLQCQCARCKIDRNRSCYRSR